MITHSSHKAEQRSVGILGRNTNLYPFVGAAKDIKKLFHTWRKHLPVAVLMLFFTEIFHLLVEQTNLYYQQHLDRQAGPSRQLSDSTFPDLVTFTALPVQMGHNLKGTLHDCWSRLRLSYTLCFTARPWDETDFYTYCVFALCTEIRPRQGIWNHLWHTEPVFDKFCNSSEHLAVDKVIVRFKGRVIFREHVSKKRKLFSIKIYKVCDKSRYTYDQECTCVKSPPRPLLITWLQHTPIVRHLTCKEEGLGHKIFMNNFISWPRLSDD
jgi:hypothetical protein